MIRNFLFLVFATCAAYVIYVYPLSAASYLITGQFFDVTVAAGASIGVACVVLLYLRTHSSSPVLSGFTHYGMGIGCIAVTVMSIGLLIALLVPHLAYHIGLVCVTLTAGLTVVALVNGRRLIVKPLAISSDKISASKELIFISDIHLGSNPKEHLVRLVTEINALSHDAVLIGGDLFDSSAFQPTDLEPLLSLQKPIFFVTGNHEFYVRNHEHKLAALADYNVQTIDNKTVMFEGIHLIGIGDNQTVAAQSAFAREAVKDDGFNLVLVHQPGIWGRLPKQADFMISGHTHNGQIFPFNLLVRLQFTAVYGLYEQSGNRLYVSSGSGCWGPRMRLGTQNEIIHLTLASG